MAHENINYWFLETIPDLLQTLADETTTHPEDMSLEEWKATLERMVFLFREGNEDTCTRYAGQFSAYGDEPEFLAREMQDYFNKCKTEGLELFNRYFWYLDM